MVVYLNKQKVSSLTEASVFADEFVLTHKVAFQSPRLSRRTVVNSNYSSKIADAVSPDNHTTGLSFTSREC